MNTSEIATAIKNKTDFLYELSEEESCKLKECLLEIFDDLLAVCGKYNIKCCLAGGSALGAIRHKGFIPWDDDLDVFMTRDDINVLLSVFDEELSSKYVIQAPNSKYECANNFIKIRKKHTELIEMDTVKLSTHRGIYIDVFPLDYSPNKDIIAWLKAKFVDFLAVMGVSQFMYMNRNEIVEKFYNSSEKGRRNYLMRLRIGRLASFLTYEKWYNIFDKASQGRRSNYITIPSGRGHYMKERLPVDVFLPFTEATFEGRKVCIPNNADAYLKNLYGNYMTMPSIEKRERHYIVKIDFNKEEE